MLHTCSLLIKLLIWSVSKKKKTHRAASLLSLLLSFSSGAWCFFLYSLWHRSSSSENCFEAERQEKMRDRKTLWQKRYDDDATWRPDTRLQRWNLLTNWSQTESQLGDRSWWSRPSGLRCSVPVTQWSFHRFYSLWRTHYNGRIHEKSRVHKISHKNGNNLK